MRRTSPDYGAFVKDRRGKYTLARPATEAELLATAATILEARIVGKELTSPTDARDFLRLKLSPLEHEVFSGLFLDTRHRVLEFSILFRGTIDSTTIYPREVVKHALRLNAAAVIFSHNHPSGVAEPSAADRALTRRLSEALALVEIRVLDHIVVGRGSTASFAELGLI
jgi:DNA repair protein RadC